MTIFWFRRDLRLHDNKGLFFALQQHKPTLCIFIFDTQILQLLNNKQDQRICFIYDQLVLLRKNLQRKNGDLLILNGTPEKVFTELTQQYTIDAVFCNHDEEPYALKRDGNVKKILNEKNIPFFSYKDHTIFERNELLKPDQTPYTVFTPYSKKWKEKISPEDYKHFPSEDSDNFYSPSSAFEMPTLQQIGFEKTSYQVVEPIISHKILSEYASKRDFPGLSATTQLSTHLRFGTISIRACVKAALTHSETWLNELIWRDFYKMILFHFPHVEKSCFKKKYDAIAWENNENNFEKWCNGQTGFPLVDAAMNELNNTGFMHNRCRMLVSSFLCKHLHIDWRWGEAYFSNKLMDFDLSANNGGWQWSAGTGCDAAPYFRIFSPKAQLDKFDPQLYYIKKHLPAYDSLTYPKPIIDEKLSRAKTLSLYKNCDLI